MRGVIEVMPPLEDLLAYIQEDTANQPEDNVEQLQEEKYYAYHDYQ